MGTLQLTESQLEAITAIIVKEANGRKSRKNDQELSKTPTAQNETIPAKSKIQSLKHVSFQSKDHCHTEKDQGTQNKSEKPESYV